jgi:hypothetical protein
VDATTPPRRAYVRNLISGRDHIVSGEADADADPLGHAQGLVRTWCGTTLYLLLHDDGRIERGREVPRPDPDNLCKTCERLAP